MKRELIKQNVIFEATKTSVDEELLTFKEYLTLENNKINLSINNYMMKNYNYMASFFLGLSSTITIIIFILKINNYLIPLKKSKPPQTPSSMC